MASQEEQLNRFFDSWEQPAELTRHCLPEADLRRSVKGRPPTDWPLHVRQCKNCRQLAELLNEPERIRLNIQDILSEASRRAWEIEHSEKRPTLSYRLKWQWGPWILLGVFVALMLLLFFS